jgi:hypothetical protein
MTRETILNVGGEGGSLTLRRERMADESWRFSAALNEMAIYESLPEEDRGTPGDYLQQSGYVESLEEALKILDKYPWFRLYPRNVHPEFFDTIMSEVRKRGGELEETRWRELLGRAGQSVGEWGSGEEMMIFREGEHVGIVRPDGSIQSEVPEMQQLNSIWQKEGIFTMFPSDESTEEVTVDGAKFVMPSEDIDFVIDSLEERGYQVVRRHE